MLNKSATASAQPLTQTPAAAATDYALTQAARPTPAISTPDCMPTGSFYQCHDPISALDFEYPSAWGGITAHLYAGDYSGYAYHYLFSGGKPAIGACGGSRDLVDSHRGCFNGFYPDKTGTIVICPDIQFAPICQQLGTNIYFIIEIPNAGVMCDPGGPVLAEPRGSVEINLPLGTRINGFVFSANILSPQLAGELASILSNGTDNASYATQQARCKDAAYLQRFDAKVSEIIHEIEAGTVDGTTQANITQLKRLAQSIHIV